MAGLQTSDWGHRPKAQEEEITCPRLHGGVFREPALGLLSPFLLYDLSRLTSCQPCAVTQRSKELSGEYFHELVLGFPAKIWLQINDITQDPKE